MNFNTSEFLFVFLPLVIVVFHVAPRIARLPVLLASSFFFYWVSGDLAFTLLVVTVVWSALMAFLVARYNSLWIIIGAVAAPLGFLFIFKYLGFALDVVGAGAGTRGHFGFILQHVLPAGISFYTFQVVSYLIDIRDGTVAPEKNPIKFATFISFFPQLIAGPILRFEQISGQLDRIAGEPRLTPDLRSGVKFLTWGLAYKILFADVLRSFHELHDLTAGGGLDALYSVLAYSLIIYFDFWSYSLMAIGLGKFFCIDLPRNFHEPYMSTSPREFWRRWHVTLSFWLRDYVYLRLGGNRAYILNIVVVFVACGIWHGAGWNFIVWGRLSWGPGHSLSPHRSLLGQPAESPSDHCYFRPRQSRVAAVLSRPQRVHHDHGRHLDHGAGGQGGAVWRLRLGISRRRRALDLRRPRRPLAVQHRSAPDCG
ncbi:MAG: MBOAT family protein [Rhodospirillaceae bacterium]|nr:MBOAT family protein [Rhodospirillaceae bacterium]